MSPVVLMQDEPFELADLRRTERDPVHVEIMGLDDFACGDSSLTGVGRHGSKGL